MKEQPEALRLANDLEIDYHGDVVAHQAAAELRRLSAENEALWKEREEPHQKIQMYLLECNRLENERDEARRTVREAHEAGTRLTAQRDALLEALKLAADFLEHSTEFRLDHPGFEGAQAKARAAIKAVEEKA